MSLDSQKISKNQSPYHLQKKPDQPGRYSKIPHSLFRYPRQQTDFPFVLPLPVVIVAHLFYNVLTGKDKPLCSIEKKMIKLLLTHPQLPFFFSVYLKPHFSKISIVIFSASGISPVKPRAPKVEFTSLVASSKRRRKSSGS